MDRFWGYAYVIVLLIAPALVVFASALYFRRARTPLSIALLIGATGQFVTVVASHVAALFLFPRLYSNTDAFMLVSRVLGVSGLTFGLVFALSLVGVMRSVAIPVGDDDGRTEVAASVAAPV